ncbi:MAG: DUF4292 domain-containing protein [Bacteroidales bacterium]|nr:DUF4292 domain-containing protein [Bacteroidales bacterium]
MRRFTNRLWLLALGFWLLALGSCSTNKNASSIRNLSANHIIREVERNQFEFDNFETKFNVKVKGDNNIGLKGQMRMQNDSIIWISLSLKVGIEVGRMMITEDSVKFINRSNRTYFSESVESFRSSGVQEFWSSGILDLLQNLLVGNDINFKEKYKATIEDNNYKLTSDKNTFLVTPKTFKVKRQQATVNGQQSTVGIDYDNFQEVNGKLLPTKIIVDAGDTFNLNIEIDYSEIKVGEELEFPFNISKKYNKIKI